MEIMSNVKEIIGLMDSPTEADKTLINKAYDFAQKAHDGHTRYSGEPSFNHLAATAVELARLGMGPKTIAAGLLHDTIEDVNIAPETIEKEFGKEILFLIDSVTKLGKLRYHGAERHRESLRKLLVATSKDVRVLIIKLADRLHNMRTLQFVPEEKRKRIALETIEIYAAIAHRLGMGMMRRELEDLAFEYAYPKEYKEVRALLTERTAQTMVHLEKMSRALKKELAKVGLTRFRTDHRVKGLYSLWRKLQRKDNDINKIYDIAALRIIVPSVEDCYRVLGMVHNLWRPLPNKIKVYIAFHKPNGYRSLHTTVFTGDGGIVEVQIRTEDMHNEAEIGIASHIFYKEGKRGDVKQSSFYWIRNLLPRFPQGGAAADTGGSRYKITKVPEWIEQLGSNQEDGDDYESSLRADFFSERVFVFTPKGDVVDLPVDSSPIDFAYAIHSDIGDHMAGAKVNGKMVTLDTKLHNGDIVEILTKKNSKPTRKWLESAKTTLARRHIRNALAR